jgi:indolepyruvate ferredoxin oxidoreductase
LIYDQQCAAEARRKRKRGQLPIRRTRVVINEAVCEGCGDCGVKSNCLSVQPVDTELGRKTRIDQTTCNTDYSCLEGNCPSFVTVELPDSRDADAAPQPPTPPDVTEPTYPPITAVHNIFLAGIGGTGIVTVNQVLAMAALRDGLRPEGLDQTGLSQKAGPVTSHLRLSTKAVESSNRVSPESADCILAFDLLTAVEAKNVGYGSPNRTISVASTSKTPTGDMVYNDAVEYPAEATLLSRLDVRSRALIAFDALAAAEKLFGNTAAANFLLVGAAYQAGAIPISANAIEEAIAINGVAVQMNRLAFRWGRVAVAEPETFRNATTPRKVSQRDTAALPHHLLDGCTVNGTTRELLERRAADLIDYQGAGLAARLITLTQNVWSQERALTDRTELSEAVTMNFFKLLAYKDEYEVARMLTDPTFVESVKTQVPGGQGLTYKLHPPILKALGRKKKIDLGPRAHFALRLLAKGKPLRGRFIDPFGHTRMRRIERQLIVHYEATVRALLPTLTPDTYDGAVAIASAAELVRGYEEVKMRNLRRYVTRLHELGVNTGSLSV